MKVISDLKLLFELVIAASSAWWCVSRIGAHPAVQRALPQSPISTVAEGHPLLRGLRIDSSIGPWRLVAVSYAVFFTILALAGLEHSLFTSSEQWFLAKGNFTFLQGTADFVNYGLLVPLFVYNATAFLEYVPIGMADFRDNLTGHSPAARAAVDNWFQRKTLAFNDHWGPIRWKVWSPLLLALCFLSMLLAYRSVALDHPIYGFRQGEITFLGCYVWTVCSVIAAFSVLVLIITVQTVWVLAGAYAALSEFLTPNPLHHDNRAGMLVVGEMMARMLIVFALSALMTVLLVIRDLHAGLETRLYHVIAPAQLTAALVASGYAFWSAHRFMVAAKYRWLRTQAPVIGGLVDADRLEAEVRKSEALKKIGEEFPTWPMSPRVVATIGGSIVLTFTSVIGTIGKPLLQWLIVRVFGANP